MKIKLLRNVIKRQNIFLELYVSIRNKFLCPYCFMDYKIVILCIFALSFKLIFPFMSIRFIIFFRWSVAYRLVHKSHECIYYIWNMCRKSFRDFFVCYISLLLDFFLVITEITFSVSFLQPSVFHTFFGPRRFGDIMGFF